jgi:hypothetical protein
MRSSKYQKDKNITDNIVKNVQTRFSNNDAQVGTFDLKIFTIHVANTCAHFPFDITTIWIRSYG